ncbi:carboxypeptidase B-like [Leptidea sinapis]|uniref:carboxypeptidase B-like n=1 Tax=Leptidea sinapis TaxID=189913 RepID=UPI00212680E3|nr:carboxypeptidase B-like [Leptidea sinapis]
MARLLSCLLLLVAAVYGRHEKYEGHQLYVVAGASNEFVELEAKLDFLSIKPAATTASGQVEVLLRLSPEERNGWLNYFQSKRMPYTLVADNLADIFREEDLKQQAAKLKTSAKNGNSSMTWERYYDYQEINDYLDSLAAEYPQIVTLINAGLSYEGKQIKYVRISSSRFEDLRKPVIVIDATIHAREWVTPPVALYLIHKLVVDVTDSDLVQNIDWIIIPMVNPDGYDYSMKEDRLWRKTRSTAHEGSDQCPGVDGNRNFDHYFGTRPASADPCSIIFEGPAPFSEPETRIIRDAILRHLDRVRLYITVHSYGNMFLYAWGNNGTLPSNGLMLQVVGVTMAQAIDKLKLDKAPLYIVGNAAQVLYYTTGTSRDWTRAIGIPYTYTLELPGYEYEFVVPPEYIKQIVTETYAGFVAGARYVHSIYNN